MSRPAAKQGSDFDVVHTFAASHPEVAGGCWYVGPQLNVGLTVMRPHAAVLRKLLHDPGWVTIRSVRYTTVEVGEVRDEVELLVRSSGITWHSLGAGLQAARADLGPEGLVLAREPHTRFGDRVRVTIGGRAYPPDGTAVPAPPAPLTTREIPGLLRAVLNTSRVTTGRVFEGRSSC